MYLTNTVEPPAFKAWVTELSQGLAPGAQPHALVLIGASARALVDSVYQPAFLREPYTRRKTVTYSESMWDEQQLPKDTHMLLVEVSSLDALARDSKQIEKALETIRAIVFLIPENTGGEFAVTAQLRLGLGNRLRPAFLVVTPASMTRTGGVNAESDRSAKATQSAQNVHVKASAAGKLRDLQTELAAFKAACNDALAKRRRVIYIQQRNCV